MAGKRHTPQQVIDRPGVAEASRRIGVTGQTFYRWRGGNGAPAIDRASRPQRAAADLTPDNRILRQASAGNFRALHIAAARQP